MSTNKTDDLSEHDENDGESQEYVAVEQDNNEQVQAEDSRHHDDDDSEDARLDEDNEDREELRRKRREEKAERAQRRKAAIERDKAELDALRRANAELFTRVQAMEKRSVNSDVQSIQSKIRAAEDEVRAAEYVISQAVNAGNGEDVAKAIRIRDEAVASVKELTVAHMRMSHQAQQFQNQPQQKQNNGVLDPIGHKLAQDWARMNPWFDPNGKDETSREVMKIDQELMNEGYNPNSLEYWHELSNRSSDVRPSRRPASKGGPQIGSGKERSQSSSRTEVYISPERRKAMEEIGAWDDPARRKKMLESYAAWDRNNKTATR